MAEVSPRVRWRNGGGWTTVLAQAENGEPAEWRISLAEIERDGPFSDYSGYDRTIVIEDGRLTLEFADRECVDLEPLVPYSFAGERAVFCRLHGAPVCAFNVMTLRDAFTHEVRVENGEVEVCLTDVFSGGPAVPQVFDSFEEWERERRRFATWEALVKLRVAQNVNDERSQLASAALASLAPLAQRRDTAMKSQLAPAHPDPLLRRRWQQDLSSYDPRIEPLLTREAELYDSYTRLTSAAVYQFQGERHTAASLAALARSAERPVREAATKRLWRFYEEHADELDGLFEQLVRCRSEMAAWLGHPSYAALAHVRLGRTDYSREDVAQLRAHIANSIVPLCARIVERQARDLGIEAIMPWDEFVFDAGKPPQTPSDAASALDALSRAFAAAHPKLGAFAQMMIARRSFDLEARHGKRGGAFCSFFPSLGTPHVFANFSGTAQDVMSVVHEMGHAFQDYSSRHNPAIEQIVPPAETGEVFSLALEFLLSPHYGEFFAQDAERYARQHRKTLLLMLPYIAAIDHFQELVYANAASGAEERQRMWLSVSERYLPYRRHGDIAHLAHGAAWHRQHHVFGFPFYYIDYALALIAALDLSRQSKIDYATTMERYVAMAAIGGKLPFRRLLAANGIADPFSGDALGRVALEEQRTL